MNQPKISLVFPCWHAAEHMQHVLDDLQAQTFKDFEAILVNDGDDSQIKAMEAIVAQDSRIRILHRQQNGGVAAARNSGTDAATTPWVTYPDPDDRFGPNYTQSLFAAVDGTGVDMACGGYKVYYVETKKYLTRDINTISPIDCLDIANGYKRMYEADVQYVAWNKLYSVDIIHKFGLRQNINYKSRQDSHFNAIYFPLIKKVGLVKNCDYIYKGYKLGLSNSTRYNPLFIPNKYETIDLFSQFQRQIGWPEQKVMDVRNSDLLKAIKNMFLILFFSDANLTIKEAAAKIQSDFFDQPELVAVIKHANIKRDRTLQLIKTLTYIGSASMTVLTFRLISVFK